MNPVESNKLWQDIVAATSEFGSDATALRIPLWVTLQEVRPSARTRVKSYLLAARQFLSIAPKKLSAISRNGTLFCFPHNTASNMNNLLPVAREALRRGVLSGILMGGDFRQQLSEFAGVVPIISIQQLTGRIGIRDRARAVARLTKAYRRISNALGKRRPDLVSSLSASRGPMVQAVASSVLFGVVVEQLLESWKPTSVISTSDFWPLEHQLCCHAAERRIPSLVIQHGLTCEFWWPFVADLCCLWGDADAEEMKRIGARPERLAVLGMPATDEMFLRAGAVTQRQQRNGRQPVCLILSNTHGYPFEPVAFDNYRQFLSEAVKSMPSITWKVKLHPVEDDSFYRQLESSVFERIVIYRKDVSLQEAVSDADIATTVFSASGLEAMIMDRPLIVAPATQRVRVLAPWPETGGGTYASSAEDFKVQVSRLISDRNCWTQQIESQRKFLAIHFANRGHAAERIVDLLETYPNRGITCSTSGAQHGALTAS